MSADQPSGPLISHRVIVQLIAATTTTTGLKVDCELDTNTYAKGIVVSDTEMASINITRADFPGGTEGAPILAA